MKHIIVFVLREKNSHDDINCFNKVEIYFQEKSENIVKNEYIMQYFQLCEQCLFAYVHFLRDWLIPYLFLDFNN